MAEIHPTAIVSNQAEIEDNVTVGPFSIIEDDVKIGKNTQIASHVVIESGSRIAENCKIFKGAVIGNIPQDLKFEDEKTFLNIGANTTVREFATLNRGTSDSYSTDIGSNCLLMAYVHIAHDCKIGNNVILANSVNVAGHVIIEDFAGIGGLTPVHQFVKIGAHSFIGGGLRIAMDVPPYILGMGEPLAYGGLNKVGLQRRGFPKKTIKKLYQAYKILYKQNNTKNQAIDILCQQFPDVPEVLNLVEFLKSSERGIIR